MAATTPEKPSSSKPATPSSAFSFLRYMQKMKPADLSPRNNELSSQDSSLDNEEGGGQKTLNSALGSSRGRQGYCTRCDNCSSDPHHTHLQSDIDSPRLATQENNNNTTSNNTANNNNNVGVNNNINNNNNSNTSNITSGRGVGTSDSEAESDAPAGTMTQETKKRNSLAPTSDGVESPHDVDLMEVIKIPEVSTRRSVVEVLSQVVKLERSSSSSASEPTRTPEAPDIVTSTTKGRSRKVALPKRTGSEEQRGADVNTLAILCQHYAQLVQALKEENYLLSCARSPLPATPRSGLRGVVGEAVARTHLGGSGGRSKSTKTVFNWDSEYIQNYEQNRPTGVVREEGDSATIINENSKLISDLRMPNSPKSFKVQRSSSRARDQLNNNTKSPRQSPARVQDDEAEIPSPASDILPKERKHWNLKPLRNTASKHKKDSKHWRKGSFSLFKESKEPEKQDTENENESPVLRSHGTSLQNPTVGVLSTKINDMEVKIQEILKLEPIDLIMRENSLDRSPARSLGCGGSLRRSASVGQRGNFYRHAVRNSRKDQRHQDMCDSDEDGSRRWCGGGVGNGSSGGGGSSSAGCQYQALAQAAHVEVDKLRQLVHLLNFRLTELSGRMLEAEARLREEHQRAAIMERCLERRSLESSLNPGEGGGWRSSRSPRHSGEGGSRRHGPSLMAWGDAATENLLRNKVDMAREEIELLRQHIDLLLRMRQEDLKVYESTVDKFRHTITSGSQW
ncbi:myosin-G heavy chain-like isoform X1 [Homarus americanus]|uniref:myosin-G heavy chain-like isoform X1 n=1 Tax=Homarus americanus TaxID=6706 RepID=UPI001C481B8C|nr:myosin-G heavy chain-like isoform X1 [Homarus americanus]